ncbi:MAG: tRNA lysidine(34) synthetase TilS [Acidobacteriia bacterium]|nr:tRNA lysidine(34) synthetase TilS [Terriglobia bacterium]
MIRDLPKRTLETIRRHGMIRPGDRIGAGVSGGADSVALLLLLNELRAQLGIGIFVLHFHHQLRDAEADEDERFVKDLAAEFHLEFIPGRADVAGEARRNAWNLEDGARRLRYQFFTSVAAAQGLNGVAVAHTADDQAETVLAHMLRGTGLTGLAGIYPVSGLVIRPLLEIGREEVREYLRSLGRAWREDSTNRDTSRMRARIRHQLLPVLRKNFEPHTVNRLARLAGHAREEESFWQSLEQERFQALASRDSEGNITLKIGDLLSPLPGLARPGAAAGRTQSSPPSSTMALSRRMVRRIVAELLGSRSNLTAQHVQDVLDLAEKSQSGARAELPGIVVRHVFDRLVFSPARVSARTKAASGNALYGREFEYAIAPPGPSNTSYIVVGEIGRRFELKVIDWPTGSGETIQHRGALDFERLRWPLTLRSWRPGDSYRPRGHRRARKLKRLFLESRVPQDARAAWPVLTSAGQLVWASGYPVAEEFAPRPGTRTGLLIAEQDLRKAPGKR